MRRLLLVLLLLLLTGCADGDGGPAPRESLADIPHPGLADAEPAVRRQLEELRTELDALLADPTTPKAPLATVYRELGERYQAYDLLDAAAPCYRNALQLDGPAPRIHHLLGVLARLEGDTEAAASSFELALDGDPDNLAARLHLAFLELDRGNAEAASERAAEVLEQDPQNAAAHLVEGRAAMAQDDATAAVPAFERALEFQPQATRTHYLLAQAHRKLGDIEAARHHLAAQGRAEVGFADPLTASLYTDLAGSAAIRQRAAGAEAAGFLEASVEAYRQAVANDPQSPDARRDLGALLAQTGSLEESIEQYREALRLQPDKALNHFSLALILEARGENREALDLFRAAVDREPGYHEFRRVLAERLAAAGDLETARTHFDHLLESDPGDDDSRLERAKVRTELGDAAGALADARQVAEGEGSDRLRASALQVQADLAVRRGDAPGARTLLDRALALEPQLPAAHFSLGILAGMNNDFEAARHHFHLVTEADPKRSAAWLGEATALALLGREAEAAARLEAGLQALPTEGSLAFTLARLLITAQDPTARNAPRALELAAPLFQTSPTPEHAELLAQALAATDRTDEAITLYRRLIDQLPPGADPALGARWRAELERLGAGGR